MVLKTDFAFSGQFSQGSLEFVTGPVRVLACGFPVVEIPFVDNDAVNLDRHNRSATGQFETVPLAHGFTSLCACCLCIVKGTIEILGVFGALCCLETLIVE